MGNVLSQVLAYKQQKEAQQNADINAIPQAMALYNQGRQQQYDNMIKGVLAQGSLAQNGLAFNQQTNTLTPFLTEQNQLKNMLTQSQIAKNLSVANLTPEKKRDEKVKTAVDIAKAKKEQVGMSGAEAGRIQLAEEGINNVKQMRQLLFPDGTPESFKRSSALKRDIFGKPVPNSEEGKKLYRLGTTAIAGRQLISTGVAARPDETKALMSAFVANAFSAPKDTFEGLQQLEDFYKGYIGKVEPSKKDNDSSNNLEVGGTFNGETIKKVVRKK